MCLPLTRSALVVQVESFSQGLKQHQKAVTADGTTVLEKAVVEHNLAAASRLYNNIYFAELGQLLGVSPAQAESVACRMIAEERLRVWHPVLITSSLSFCSIVPLRAAQQTFNGESCASSRSRWFSQWCILSACTF